MKAILKTNIIITQKGPSLKQPFSVSRYCNHSRNSIGLRAHSLHGAELNQSLEQSKNRDCLRIRPRRVTDTFLFKISFLLQVYYNTKKAPANARASTTTAMVSLLQCEGRWYTPFRFLVCVVWFNYSQQLTRSSLSQHESQTVPNWPNSKCR